MISSRSLSWRRRLWASLFPRWFFARARPTTREIGALGELAAARHVRELGWRVLGRNVRTSAGEVDLVALDGPQLVCVEVKTARAERADPLPSEFRPGRHFDAVSLARQRRAAAELGRHLGGGRFSQRVDLLEVVFQTRTGRAHVVLHRSIERPLPL